MEDITRIRLAVRKLIEINRRRFASYRSAARQFSTLELKALFMNFALQSVRFRKDLYRWMEEAEAKNDRKNLTFSPDESSIVLNSGKEFSFSNFVTLEEDVMRAYQAVLATSYFPFEALKQIEQQMKEIESARNIFKVIRGGVSRQLKAA